MSWYSFSRFYTSWVISTEEFLKGCVPFSSQHLNKENFPPQEIPGTEYISPHLSWLKASHPATSYQGFAEVDDNYWHVPWVFWLPIVEIPGGPLVMLSPSTRKEPRLTWTWQWSFKWMKLDEMNSSMDTPSSDILQLCCCLHSLCLITPLLFITVEGHSYISYPPQNDFHFTKIKIGPGH